jgi:hypothetical protein
LVGSLVPDRASAITLARPANIAALKGAASSKTLPAAECGVAGRPGLRLARFLLV